MEYLPLLLDALGLSILLFGLGSLVSAYIVRWEQGIKYAKVPIIVGAVVLVIAAILGWHYSIPF